MKKPRSYLQAVADANPGHLTVVNQHGKEYLATLAPIGGATRAASPPPPSGTTD